MSATTRPTRRFACIRKLRATPEGAKSSCATASSTRAFSCGLTKLVLLMTFETVAVETRARRATSLIVGAAKALSVLAKHCRTSKRLGRLSHKNQLLAGVPTGQVAQRIGGFSRKRPNRNRRLERLFAIAFVLIFLRSRGVSAFHGNDLGQSGLIERLALD